jgi:hypothetical protein
MLNVDDSMLNVDDSMLNVDDSMLNVDDSMLNDGLNDLFFPKILNFLFSINDPFTYSFPK